MISNKMEIDTSRWPKEYFEQMYNFAYYRTNDPNLAADMVQDTFLAGLRGLERFDGRSTVKVWLFSILKRKIIDYWRSKNVRKTRPFSHYKNTNQLSEGYFEELIDSKERSPQQTIENNELKEIILNNIHALPGKWEAVVIDRLIHEKSFEEICEAHELSINNCWVIMHRAKKQLRQGLERALVS